MAKQRRVFVCESCGYQEPKWLGRCPACQGWSTFVEEVVANPALSSRSAGAQGDGLGGGGGGSMLGARGVGAGQGAAEAVPLSEISTQGEARQPTGIVELDRVLGGGIVDGSLILVGGDPGIGKSTLLLQALGCLAQQGLTTLYMTAEESAHQVHMRAKRLGVTSDGIYLLAETQLGHLDAARRKLKPRAIVVDSVQTVGVEGMQSAIGSVGQIRAVTHHLMNIAKGENIATVVVGHVTKEGTLAGPKVMEHMVDTVLYFEGERTGPYRVLRTHKNRFGSAQEIGVFEMQSRGLCPVPNPSALFLSQRAFGPGSVVVTSLEGSRPILLEVQALVTQSLYGTAKRTTQGFDGQRVAMLCAVLAARVGLELSDQDTYVNVTGGVRANEPAADLGVVCALASAHRGRPIPEDTVLVGEVGLAGEVRGVSQLEVRVQEAAALGFKRCIVPQVDLSRLSSKTPEVTLEGVRNVHEALAAVHLM